MIEKTLLFKHAYCINTITQNESPERAATVSQLLSSTIYIVYISNIYYIYKYLYII